MRRRVRVTAAVVAVGFVLTGCSNEPAPPMPPGETEPGDDGVVSLNASDNLRFSTSVITASAGEVGFQLRCGGAVVHNLVIEGVNDDDPVAACDRGEEGAPGFADLEPGVYTYLCDIPGHRITMNGELTVTE